MEYIYYKRDINGKIYLFRVPDNGNKLYENSEIIEVYKDKKWVKDRKKIIPLINDCLLGWILEKEDQLTKKEIFELMSL